MIDLKLLRQVKDLMNKEAAVPMGPAPVAPPMDPAMMGGAPMDPSMMGGMPPPMGGAPPMPMDPAMMGGMPPPMDPAMMGGAPPMDPAMMGGMPPPPMDPAMMGGMPPMDPAMMGAPPVEEPVGTPLTEERFLEILPKAIEEMDKEKSGEPTKADLEARVDEVENQVMEVMGAVGMAPPVAPEDLGVVEEDTTSPPLGEETTEVPEEIQDGMTPEALEAAAEPPEEDPAAMGMGGAQPPMPGMPPPGMPPQGMPGMPVMASSRQRKSSVMKIQDLIKNLRS